MAPHFQCPTEEKPVIPFIEKTWFVWWTVAVVVILRWVHVMSSGEEASDLDPLVSEEELAYIRSWQILRKAQSISLRVFGD
jgi:hypothetical protein